MFSYKNVLFPKLTDSTIKIFNSDLYKFCKPNAMNKDKFFWTYLTSRQ